MEKKESNEKFKFTDWSKHTVLSQHQLKQLINEKTFRAKIQLDAMQKVYRKLG